MLIGLCGYAGAGKDAAGKFLIEQGFERLAFADAIKDCLHALNPWIPIEVKVHLDVTPKSDFRMRRLQEIVKESGWDVAKEVPEVRRLLQRLGSEVGRDILGEETWVNLVLDQWRKGGYDHTVITDVRTVYEAAAIQEALGEVWRIDRPGVGPLNEHATEMDIDRIVPDVRINNDDTLDHLRERVLANLKWVK